MIGDQEKSDIINAKTKGFITCYLRYNNAPSPYADFNIQSLSELL
jgi:FMN phosphatase YigB (HAD superfamily)